MTVRVSRRNKQSHVRWNLDEAVWVMFGIEQVSRQLVEELHGRLDARDSEGNVGTAMKGTLSPRS